MAIFEALGNLMFTFVILKSILCLDCPNRSIRNLRSRSTRRFFGGDYSSQ